MGFLKFAMGMLFARFASVEEATDGSIESRIRAVDPDATSAAIRSRQVPTATEPRVKRELKKRIEAHFARGGDIATFDFDRELHAVLVDLGVGSSGTADAISASVDAQAETSSDVGRADAALVDDESTGASGDDSYDSMDGAVDGSAVADAAAAAAEARADATFADAVAAEAVLAEREDSAVNYDAASESEDGAVDGAVDGSPSDG